MENMDRPLIARVISDQMKRHPEIRGRKSRLAASAHIQRETLDNALTPGPGVPATTIGTYNAIEQALDLLPDTLIHIGKREWGILEDDGEDAGLIGRARRFASRLTDSAQTERKAL